ncbi:hypothetical protein HID58_014390 [Brassica napus]|uniref:CobW/HypB/UreG nucleotide-binding domain-containing protein n=1 Tax=Brassica napus TaxID=3708 RepID=A0ABQ8DH47_BRANA|nr:hypothetical protein HID58_014390 [Brassica napus]
MRENSLSSLLSFSKSVREITLKPRHRLCFFPMTAPLNSARRSSENMEGTASWDHGALPEERIRAVETGGCPHAAIREDISINLGSLEELSNLFKTDLLLCESGGVLCVADDLAANFSRELADYIIYIIDVSTGDKIPRKGGPGITQADLLVINKTELAAAVGADLSVMERDALRMRDGGPFVFAQVKHGLGVEEIVNHVMNSWEQATGNKRH